MASPPQDSAADRQPGKSPIPAILPTEDLTLLARTGKLPSAVDFSAIQIEETIRTLYRKTARHVLITGPKGVGKSTFLREIARVASNGDNPFLAGKRFIWIDCQYVAREDSRGCLETILQFAFSQSDLVLCLDGLSALVRRPGGEDNKTILKSALAHPGIQVVATLSKWEFNDLIGTDAELLEYFTRIELDEPHGDVLRLIVQEVARQLESEFDLIISGDTVRRTLALCSSYILNEHFPSKAARILRHACEDLDFERTQRGASNFEVSSRKIVEIVAATTGVPETTLLGEADQPDFEAALSADVFGQTDAVAAVAAELRLIRAGLVDPNKPATVLLFAGMTGVGKTELAKWIAKLYSSSGQIQTYPMGNFTEPHSVSGIIGVPPGYVGHEQGGRLVNDLNSDPYSVFLLDEGEKAHPNIWVPFLNLFDEGWLIDQRGRKAYADRAIFVLTTNAGADSISQMTAAGQSQEDIETRVRQMLSKVRHERSSQPVFTPQFLARIKKVIVFRPLDETAMLHICRKLVTTVQVAWQQRRDKRIEISEEVIMAIAGHAHQLNQKSGGREGGRIVRKLLSEFVESKIQTCAVEQSEAYKQSTVISVTASGAAGTSPPDGSDPSMLFDVSFDHVILLQLSHA